MPMHVSCGSQSGDHPLGQRGPSITASLTMITVSITVVTLVASVAITFITATVVTFIATLPAVVVAVVRNPQATGQRGHPYPQDRIDKGAHGGLLATALKRFEFGDFRALERHACHQPTVGENECLDRPRRGRTVDVAVGTH